MTRSVTDPLTPVQLDRLMHVVDHVAGLYGLDRSTLLFSTDHRSAEARGVVVYAAVFELNHSFTQLAVTLGNRSRYAMSIALDTVQRRMRFDDELTVRVQGTQAFARNLLAPAKEARTA